jgi:hypothetical protein
MPTFPKPPGGNPGPTGSPSFPAPEPPKKLVPERPKKTVDEDVKLPIAEKPPASVPPRKPS